MVQQKTTSYFFLGANSAYGFYSLYDQFAANPKDHLTIIKSGPGTGKSTFMKRIGAAAEENGYDVEYILCSGDPHSLDGVYIPTLHKAWVDGTAPHVLEPRHFGIDGTYEDLGKFCHTEILNENAELIQNTTALYRSCYKKAYSYLNAAANLFPSVSTVSSETEERVRKRAQAKIKRELHASHESTSKPIKRFISAISCIGRYTPISTLNMLCDRLCVLSSTQGLEQIFFQEILAEANKQNQFYIQCPSPLLPEYTEAVIFPEQKLCFCTLLDISEFDGIVRMIHLDNYEELSSKSEHKQKEKLYNQLLDASFVHLRKAKQYHDELESLYRPSLDISGLSGYTEEVISDLF